jgi:outer membrane autotransporter protein
MDRSGLAIGADTYLSKEWLLGLAMSTGQGRFTGMDANTHDRANIKNHELIAYSEYALNPLIDARVIHAQGWANTTGSRYDNNMEMAAGSDYRSRYHHSSFELALRHQLSSEFRIIPSLGLAYTHVTSDPYLDTSRLSVREEKSDALVGVMKANFEYIQDANKLGIQVGLKHDWKAQRSQPQLIAADGYMFSGQGIETKANRALLGLTYQRQFKKDLEFDLAYDLDRSSNYISHAANAKLKMLF